MKDTGFPSIPGYEFVRLLGYGCGGAAACSSLYLARKRDCGLLVALKISNQRGHDRFPVDVAAVGRLEHPNILRVIEVGELEDYWYEALEYVEARTLSDKLRQGPLPVTVALALGAALASALQCARDQGMIHRSPTPRSIVLAEENVPKLHPADFATSVENAQKGDHVLGLVGDPAFCPPEYLDGECLEITPAMDVYRVGAVLYAMLTGRPPYVGDDAMTVVQQALRAPPVLPRRLNSKVPGGLEAVCMTCLEKAPQRRYASVGCLAEALDGSAHAPDPPAHAGEGLRARLMSRVLGGRGSR